MKWLLLSLLTAAAVADDSTLKAFRDANIKFTANLYKELIKTDTKRVLASPLSVQIILALVHAGAKAKTAEQIAAGLSLPNDNAAIQRMVKAATASFSSESYYTGNIANKVYVKQNFKVKEEFVKTAVNDFKSDVENIDFDKVEHAAKSINDWVEAKTNHTIREIISADDIDDTLRMVLLNTIYMQVHWMNEFIEEHTLKKDFYVNKEKTIKVDMMKNEERYGYYECQNLNARFLKMDYRAPGMSMVLVRPNDKDGLPGLEKRIDDVLNHNKFDTRQVKVEFPKFDIDTTIQLNPILEALGIIEPFTPDADLTGISDADLYVSKVMQKNHIEVNEKGTIASSATAIRISLDMAFMPNETKKFVANHPFIYYVQSRSGIMFVGKFTGNSNGNLQEEE